MLLSTILKEYGIDIKHTKLVRHPLSKKEVSDCYIKGMIEAYQNEQSKPVFDKCTHVLTFIGTAGGEALFYGVYEVKGVETKHDKIVKKMPKAYPYPEHYEKAAYYYNLKKLDVMDDLKGRLFIEWKNERSWAQWAETDKKVMAITLSDEKPFPGYDELRLSYDELKLIAAGELRYQKWIDALKNVNGIYLICDKKYNKMYIGSTYNKEGIYGRWYDYATTKHGGDKGIKAHLRKHPDAIDYFEYSILQVLSLSIDTELVLSMESVYKTQFNTRNKDYGLNLN